MKRNKISGRCLCGHIKYEYWGELSPASYCHCPDCRKETGSAFVVTIRFEEKYFKITTGNNTKSYTKIADDGDHISRNFCPNCGSQIFAQPHSYPGYIWIRAGTLDDPGLVKPAHQSWTKTKVDWAEISKEIKSYNKSRN